MMISFKSAGQAGIFLLCTCVVLSPLGLLAQQSNPLLRKVQEKLNTVKNYRAEGILKTDVSFIKIPESKVTVLFKNPNRFKIRKQEGITIVPKGGVNLNLNSLLNGKEYTSVDAGQSTINGQPVAVIKLLPTDENSDIVLSTLYIDEKNAVVRKAKTSTRNNGSYEMELVYSKYLNWGLPDKVSFLFNTKDYKLPKGVTFEYETNEKPPAKPASTEGRIDITYHSYIVNKGISDKEFE